MALSSSPSNPQEASVGKGAGDQELLILHLHEKRPLPDVYKNICLKRGGDGAAHNAATLGLALCAHVQNCVFAKGRVQEQTRERVASTCRQDLCFLFPKEEESIVKVPVCLRI